ncbi:MAG TPA: hypothetical protein ENJ95_21325 [Bacteroidetes bacterium]|nr:hypothetical protein [Bacteroidota bacterium]
MKYLILLIAQTLLFSACNFGTKSTPALETETKHLGTLTQEGLATTVTITDPKTGNPIQAQRPVKALSAAIGDKPIVIIDPTPPKLSPPNPKTAQEQRVVRVLTTDIWCVWQLIRIKDMPANKRNQGVWFKFNIDGTYKYGIWDKTISEGTWSFDGKTAYLYLDSKLYGDDREWRIQMGSGEEVMIWIGTERFATTGIQLKLERFYTVPKDIKELRASKN